MEQFWSPDETINDFGCIQLPNVVSEISILIQYRSDSGGNKFFSQAAVQMANTSPLQSWRLDCDDHNIEMIIMDILHTLSINACMISEGTGKKIAA